MNINKKIPMNSEPPFWKSVQNVITEQNRTKWYLILNFLQFLTNAIANKNSVRTQEGFNNFMNGEKLSEITPIHEIV